VLRRHVRPDGKLFFSVFLDRLTPGGHGLMDALARGLEAHPEAVDGDAAATGVRRVQPFCDLYPDQPLLAAMYSEEYARQLIDEGGWRVVSMADPDVYIQHSFVCAPA
jgi:hypothetical protein